MMHDVCVNNVPDDRNWNPFNNGPRLCCYEREIFILPWCDPCVYTGLFTYLLKLIHVFLKAGNYTKTVENCFNYGQEINKLSIDAKGLILTPGFSCVPTRFSSQRCLESGPSLFALSSSEVRFGSPSLWLLTKQYECNMKWRWSRLLLLIWYPFTAWLLPLQLRRHMTSAVGNSFFLNCRTANNSVLVQSSLSDQCQSHSLYVSLTVYNTWTKLPALKIKAKTEMPSAFCEISSRGHIHWLPKKIK